MVFDFAGITPYILRPHLVVNWKGVTGMRIFGCETTVSIAEIDESAKVIVRFFPALAATSHLPVEINNRPPGSLFRFRSSL